MFILELERPDGTPLLLSYDPLASRIADMKGRDFDLSPLGLAYEEGPRFREVRPFGPEDGPAKSRRIGRLKIQLGLGCNYRCAYCCQQEGRAATVGSQGDVARFLAGLPNWMETPPDSQDLRVEFWGGEPFVYWKTLKPLAEGLRARFPRALFSLTTNGMGAVRLRHSTHWARREECRHCPVLAFCGGSCMYTEGVEREMSCDAELSQGLALLALALYLPTNARLRAVRGERIRFPGIREILFDAACSLR